MARVLMDRDAASGNRAAVVGRGHLLLLTVRVRLLRHREVRRAGWTAGRVRMVLRRLKAARTHCSRRDFVAWVS
jgi:hypothetical protein